MTSLRQHTVTITDDNYTVTLSSGNWTIRDMNVVPGAPQILMHQPDYDFARPVRATDPLRTATLVLDYYDSTDTAWESPIADLERIKLMIDGAYSQALRYWLQGDIQPVYLDIKPYNAGAELTSRSEIVFGHLDDSMAYYDEAAVNQYRARMITLTLVLTEYSEATTYGTVTLANYLTGSPGMTEYSGSSPTQLAYGITRVDAGSTCTIDTTNWCVGGSSQKVVCAAADDGINFPDVDLTGTDHVAFVWIYPVSGTVRFQAYDVDAASVTHYEDISPANTSQADRTYVDYAGATWYRIPLVLSTWTTGNTCRLQLIAQGGAATFYCDAAYLEQGQTVVPPFGWASARSIDNRNDHTSTNTSYINYVDVWDIPGDSPALCRIRGTYTIGASSSAQIFGAFTDGRYQVGDVTHWVEEDDADITTSASTGTSWGSQADVNRSGGSYQRWTSTTLTTNSGALLWKPTSSESQAFAQTDKRVFALVRTNSTGITNGNYLDTTVNGITQTSGFTMTTANAWEMIDCGTIRLAGLIPTTTPGTAEITIGLGVYDPGTTAANVDVDAIMFIPLTDEFLISGETLATSGDVLWVDGYQDTILPDKTTDYSQYTSPEFIGRFRHLYPKVTNRILFIVKRANNAHTLTDAIAVDIDIKRRSRHLLGGV